MKSLDLHQKSWTTLQDNLSEFEQNIELISNFVSHALLGHCVLIWQENNHELDINAEGGGR